MLQVGRLVDTLKKFWMSHNTANKLRTVLGVARSVVQSTVKGRISVNYSIVDITEHMTLALLFLYVMLGYN